MRIVIILLFFAVLASAQDFIVSVRKAAGGGAPTLPQAGSILAHYDFSDGSGATLTDIENGHDGTIVGATWSTTCGPSSDQNCLVFDGSGDYVTLPAGVYDGLQGLSAYTIAIWAEASSYGVYAGLSASKAAPTRGVTLYPFDIVGGNGARTHAEGSTLLNEDGATDADSAPHLFVTTSRSATDHELYKDDATSIATSSSSTTLDSDLVCSDIGALCLSGHIQQLVGEIYRVVVWTTGLSSAEVGEVYDVSY